MPRSGTATDEKARILGLQPEEQVKRFWTRARAPSTNCCPPARTGGSVLAASVFNSGLLATARPAEGATFDYAPAAPRTLERAHCIADVCETRGVTLPEAAMAFPLRHPAPSGIVVGMRTADEVRRSMEAFGTEKPAQVWDDLRSKSLLDERAPVHV